MCNAFRCYPFNNPFIRNFDKGEKSEEKILCDSICLFETLGEEEVTLTRVKLYRPNFGIMTFEENYKTQTINSCFKSWRLTFPL